MRRLDSGFSIIELIVSLTLLAMILALLPGAFRTGKRGWETAVTLDQRAAENAAVEFLRHRLAEAMPLFDRDDSGRTRLAFSGASQDVSFVAPASSGPFGGGLYRFGVALEPGNVPGQSQLLLRMTPYRPAGLESTPPATEHVLMSGMGSLQLRYFGALAAGDEPVWSSDWRRQDQLPDLIELFSQSNAKATRSLGPLIVELKLKPAGR